MEYFVSVIMPVYNVDKYLEEAIDSVIAQTLGFRENIQLILVNDGSPDRSGDICRKYKAEYPDNIVYIEKENGGVSSARNAGIRHVKGKFVNFMDADDIWGKDAFRLICDFLYAHKELKIASGSLQYTGRDEGRKYALDYVYRRTRVVNIEKAADMPLFGLPKIFFSAELVRNRHFDTALAVSEDQLFLMDALLEHGKFGVVSDAVYYYRKRDDGSSAYDGARARADYYTVTPGRAFKTIIGITMERYGSVIPYIQNVMLVNLRFRIKPVPEGVLSEAELSEYRGTMREILSVISDDIILSQKKMLFWQKVYFLKAKYCSGGLGESTAKKLQKSLRLQVDGISLQDTFMLSGDAHEKWISEDCSVYAEDDRGTRYYPEYTENPENDKEGLFGDISLKGYRHEMALPLRDSAVYHFFTGEGENRTAANLRLKRELKASDEDAVFENNDYLISVDESSVIISSKKKHRGMMDRLLGGVSRGKNRKLCILCMALLCANSAASAVMPADVYAASSKVRIGHAVTGEKGLKGNKPGDQTGKEAFIEDWAYGIFSGSGYHWVYVLRPKDHDLARAIATHMVEICENNKIGYDQNHPDKGTLFDEAKKNDWDIAKIKTRCETTCSNAVSVCLRAEGVKVPKFWNTSRMKEDLLKTDMFECMDTKAYTKSPDKLVVGDILITPGRHTAIVVESDNPFTYRMTYKNKSGDTLKIEVEENTFVRLNPNNGSKPENVRMDSDKDISEEKMTLRDHTFIGWKKTGNRTLTALYRPERQKMNVVTEKVKI